mmetsp:Transcript_6132/g.10420  ORF Transcript_6132/g.10420 Transcript_6132/m.10420 type:complete len:102 (+) Transcript_6132:564-869(+)
MARDSQLSELRSSFAPGFRVKDYEGTPMRLDWPRCASKRGSVSQWRQMKKLRDLVQTQASPSHLEFLKLLESMMVVDPKERPTAQACLEHEFFKRRVSERE